MDIEARRVIEALRSGIPSRIIGESFTAARTELLAELSGWINDGIGGGKMISGNYGEGKTHLLNTMFTMAHRNNMAVSVVTLSKETPLNRLQLVYQKVALNTYLPNREQPGFGQLLDTLGSLETAELQLYAAKELQTDKLYYLMKVNSGTDNPEHKFSVLADLQGDFMLNSQIKKLYQDIYGEKMVFSANFLKTRHVDDYFRFVSRLFRLSGLRGWVILFDEAEHTGRLARKSRFAAYVNMTKLINLRMKNTYLLFAMHESYASEIIEAKEERKYLALADNIDREAAEEALRFIEAAQELAPLSPEELMDTFRRILDYHSRAYDWTPNTNAQEIYEVAKTRGYLLRTKIRVAIEYLDQLLQYGDVGLIASADLDQEEYREEIPLPEEL